MADKTAAGAKLYIGGTEITGNPSDETQSSLEGYSYTEVGRVQDLGSLGDAFNVSNYTELNDRRVKRIATFKDGGEISVTTTFVDGDSGQDAVIAALGKDYPWKIELDDAPAGSGTTPTTFYFAGMCTANRRNLADGSNVLTREIPIQVQSDIFEVAAA